MRLRPTEIDGVWVCEPVPVRDERGFFARLVDADVLAAHGLRCDGRQRSVAYNRRRGTVRGMHWQVEPDTEVKLVRCTRGAVHDVVVDVRPGSPTYLRHVSIELSADNRLTLHVPPLVAHGYQTLTDHAEVSYDIDGVHNPAAARGVRFDDPDLGIEWPLPATLVNERDRSWPLVSSWAP